MKDDFHVDMSGRIYSSKTIGIALVGTQSKINYGCALNGSLIIKIKRELFRKNIIEDAAKLYAICIYFLVKEVRSDIRTLIICNDEDFQIVKSVLTKLLVDYDFEIINISEFRKRLGRNIGSLADNYARIYRKKALNLNKLGQGREINVVKVSFKSIKTIWEEIK